MNNCYVYTFASSLDGSVFYVGKGSGNRIKSHFWEALSTKRERVSRVAQTMRTVWQRGGKIIVRKPYNHISSLEACRLETLVIESYGYENLVNSRWAKHRNKFVKLV